ncbi:uncharacterized protein PITG_09358 [Phytophthora infestans T30-4]|uniref:Uncharacterized protein n=1 Tax=Phytophthora infestans (strain T30-4) TaxID=403677 RepID=D0NBH4_PHYIT|nr:uncharacterized protein PITG_09358 [Phytophthora infestans T30-4]EEY55403.1 hypothetical protein PITG_09358 [Phytophthora infestans T30-4]|eukprot:XP_002903627.1 hypothetical protein PITG_09358 [Phytophthora infestans T30-4]
MKALLHRAHLHRWDALKKSFDSIFVWRYHEEDPDAQTYVVRYLAIAELLNEGTVVRPQGDFQIRPYADLL